MSTWIKAGFWEKLCKPCKGYKGWLNLDNWFQEKKGYRSYTANLGCTADNQVVPKYVFENTIGNITFSTAVQLGTYSIIFPEPVNVEKLYVGGFIFSDNYANYVKYPIVNGTNVVGYVSWYAGITASGEVSALTISTSNAVLNDGNWRDVFSEDPLDPTQYGTTGLFLDIRVYN